MTRQDLPGVAGRLTRVLLRSQLLGILVPVVLVAGAMSFAFPGFASAFNVDALLATVAVGSVIGLSQVAVLAVGQFNLALPAFGAFTGTVLGWLLQYAGLPWTLAVVLAVVFAAMLGLVQGLLIVRLRLNAFIVTLGLASAYYGLMYVVLGNERFQHLGTALPRIGRGAIGPVPNIFLIAMATCALGWFASALTVPGRWLLATGASPLAARFSALPVAMSSWAPIWRAARWRAPRRSCSSAGSRSARPQSGKTGSSLPSPHRCLVARSCRAARSPSPARYSARRCLR
jgi:ribose transport system permease protein